MTISSSEKKIGLFIGADCGYEVLQALLLANQDISGAIILVQDSHEINNFTDKIKNLCEKHGVPYRTSAEVKPNDYATFLAETAPDIVFLVGWRFLVPQNCFVIPPRGMYVIHDSLLPAYRGFAPTNWAIINGEKESGLTLLSLAETVDSGKIFDQIRILLEEKETATSLNKKLLVLYPKIILDNLEGLLDGTIPGKEQDESTATYTCKRIPDDGKISFHKKTVEIERLIRALSHPYPGAFCFLDGEKMIIWEAEEVANPQHFVGRIPGRVVRITDDFVEVLTGDGILRIKKIAYATEPNEFLRPKNIIRSITKTLL